MKNLLLILLSVCFFAACQQEEDLPSIEKGKGEVAFSFDVKSSESASNGRVLDGPTPDMVVVSIETSAGTPVYTQEQLSLIEFNGSYVSEPISLEVGDYKLTEYLVLDSNGETVYATPLSGSDLDYLVNTPLAIDFSLTTDASDQIVPEVLATAEVTAADFGYEDFKIAVVNTFDFLMSVHYFDQVSESYELTDAEVTIYGDGSLVYDKPIAAETDQIRIRDDYANFQIVTSKSGHLTDTVNVDVATLKAYFNDPLEVLLQPITGYFYANNNLNNATPAIWTQNKTAVGMDVVPGEPHKIQFEVSGTFQVACATWVARPNYSDPAIMSLFLNGNLVGEKIKTDPSNPQWIEMHGADRGEWIITVQAGDIIELTVNGVWDGAGGNDYLEITQQ